jgi:glycosyltransferase-like protein
MFTYSTAPRGSVVHAAALAEALTRLGCDVTLYALNKGSEGFYRQLECKLELVPAQPARGTGAKLIHQRIAELATYVKGRRITHDIYHAQDCLTANGLFACNEPSAARVFRTVHHVERFDCPYLEACQERSIRNANVLHSVSNATAAEVLARFGRHCQVVGNGVDTNRLSNESPSRIAQERQRLLGANAGPLLLSIGGVEPRKNALRTLDAFARVKRSYPTAVWAIVGGATALDHGQYVQEFEASLRTHAWHRDVVRVGIVEEERLGALFGAADVLLNASVQEGFGLTVLEGLAVGLPVVLSKGAPFNEYVTAQSAFVADPESAESIASAVVAAIGDPTRCQLAARSVALEHVWSAVARRTMTAYRRGLEAVGARRKECRRVNA